MTLRPRGRERGGALMIVVPALIGIFALTALVVDLGFARQTSRHVHASADAAALAGSRSLPVAGHDSTAAAESETEAAQYVNLNLTGSSSTPTSTTCESGAPAGANCYTVGDATVTVASPYVGSWAGAPPSYGLIYVEICQPTPTFFAGVIGATSPTVCRDAVARRYSNTGGYDWGLVVMDPSECGAVTFAGNSDTILSSNGAVMVNSACDNPISGALDASGTSWQLHANYIGVVGNATLSPCDPDDPFPCTTTTPTEGIDHFDDPIGVVPPDPKPAVTTTPCPSSWSGSGPFVLQPGRYNGSCTFEGNNRFIFRPGTYYFESGIRTSGSASLVCSDTATTYPLPAGDTCAGVTFIIGGGAVDMTGTGSLFLPPPDTGPYAGISIYQINPTDSKITGTADFNLGTIYAPASHYEFTGSGGSKDININGLVVTNTASISGSFNFNINVPIDGETEAPVDEYGLER